MNTTFVTAGLACVIAAIVGGGLNAFSIEIPLLSSMKRQVLLGIFGAALLAAGFFVPAPADERYGRCRSRMEPSRKRLSRVFRSWLQHHRPGSKDVKVPALKAEMNYRMPQQRVQAGKWPTWRSICRNSRILGLLKISIRV